VDPRVFDRVLHASGTDFSEARAMNRALWPATFGYAMQTMMHPVFDDAQAEATRWFYTHFVAGRGMLPSLRVGHQPYGVLPISAISKWTWLNGDRLTSVGGLALPANFIAYRQGLAALLAQMRTDWSTLAQAVSRVGESGDAHQMLLDVIGLHPASVEFHQRYAESLDHIFNRAKLQGFAPQIIEYIRVQNLQISALALLRRLGYSGRLEPDALRSVAPEAAGGLILTLDASVSLLASRWPIDAIWRANQSGAAEEGVTVDLSAGGVTLEVRRRGDDVGFRVISPAVHAFRRALAGGCPLVVATEHALAADPGFDLPGELGALFREGLPIGFTRSPSTREDD
jgi:hypothetical protein